MKSVVFSECQIMTLIANVSKHFEIKKLDGCGLPVYMFTAEFERHYFETSTIPFKQEPIKTKELTFSVTFLKINHLVR